MTERATRTVPVSKKRMIVAVYLDLVLFSAAWGLAVHLFTPGRQFTAMQYLTFAVVEALLLAIVKWSPGEYLLSISHRRTCADPLEPEGAETSRQALVDRRVWSQESLLTAALGVYLVVDGCKSLVRWTMWTPPQPFFGMRLSPTSGASLAVFEGVAYTVLGALVLRLRPSAPWGVTMFSLYQLAAIVSSWTLWDDFAREMLFRRRDYQGLPVRGGEVEFAQLLVPEAAIVLIAAQVIVVLAFRGRFAVLDRAKGVV